MATITIENLGFPWATRDPFLFCVHHLDFYPKGNGKGGPAATLRGRQIGNDFIIKDGWRMYHGDKIPGFPAHPHRGFETVTVVQRGMVDHADSMGAAGRYGGGDVQWMTAGSGVQHSEMFPLLEENQGNTLELFQIWLNLPKHRKMVDPNFKMLWAETIPTSTFADEAGRSIQVIQYCKGIGAEKEPVPTPDSWASDAINDVAIWVISFDELARWELPEVLKGVHRSLYLYEGKSVEVAGEQLKLNQVGHINQSESLKIINGESSAKLLLLQGRPIGEPVVQYGPFVMNSRQEIVVTYEEYRRTQFGGWPWKSPDQIHGLLSGRFARHANGVEEKPTIPN